MSMIGHNSASPQDLARDTFDTLGAFLKDNPVIDADEQAREGGLLVERTRKLFQDIEDARKAEVAPLNEQVKKINTSYRDARGPLENLFTTLRLRLTDYAAREEAKRIRAAEEARLAAEAAEMEARRAEEAEREAKQNATFGEVTDVAAAVVAADQAFADFQRADRAAAVAERGTTVRLPSQLGGRALSMREKETLVLVSYSRALKAIGPHDKIRDAILSVAREYRKQKGHLPDGVEAEFTRAI